jgi:hypothetical protein
VERALFTSAHAGADVENAGGLEFLAAPVGIDEEGVASVYEDVAGLEVRL